MKELLLKLAFIYDLNLETMQTIIRESLNEKNAIDKDKIRDMNTLSQARLKEMYDFEKICTVFLRTLLGGKYDEYFVTQQR